MNYNIKDYAVVYRKSISEEIIKNIIHWCENEATISPHWYSDYDGKKRNSEKEFDTCWLTENEKGIDIWSVLKDIIWNNLSSYYEYCSKNVELSLPWNGFTTPRINIYNKNTIMHDHVDHIHNVFDGERKGIPTCTVLGLLKNAELGGEFIMWGEEKINMESGDIIIFPSNFMFRHGVREIVKGQRISFVSWVW